MDKFNYVVGHYWESSPEQIGTYRYFGEVHYGTMEDAEGFLTYVKSQSPEHEWKIFKLQEIGTVATATDSNPVIIES